MKKILLFSLASIFLLLILNCKVQGWNIPSHVSPSDGTVNILAGVTIDWNAVMSSDAYQFQVDTLISFNSPVLLQGTKVYINSSSSNADTREALSDLYYGKTYYWRVRAYITGDTSAWSAPWSFTVTANGPALVNPSNGALNQSTVSVTPKNLN